MHTGGVHVSNGISARFALPKCTHYPFHITMELWVAEK